MQAESEREREEIFAEHLRMARLEEMTSMLRCKLCNGLLRFAHTLAQCGHSFCQHCIFSYINAFKGRNPEIKCPQCHTTVEPAFHRSVIRDAFKQSLVDLLDPTYAAREKTIIDRIRRLFPELNLSFLIEDFTISASDSLKRRRAEKSRVMNGLASAVREKLGISFQSFADQVADDDAFEKLLACVASEQDKEKLPFVLDLRPRSQHDFRFVGINSKVKGSNYLVSKMRKYLQKHVLLRLKANKDLALELIDPECNDLQVRVQLFFQDRLLEDSEEMSLIPGIDQEPIYYRLIK